MGTLRLLERVSIILSLVILCGIIMPVLLLAQPASANGVDPVVTEPATDVTSDTATLNGWVNLSNDPLWVSFDYGTTSTVYDSSTTEQPFIDPDGGPFSDAVSGLLPGTTYYFRAVWYDESIYVFGDELSFTTAGGVLYYGFEVNHRLTVDLNGKTCTVPSRYTGEIYEAVDLTSTDGKYNVKLPAGSIALDSEGKCLFELDIEVATEVPNPPDIPNVVAYVCLCEPAGATLEGPLTLTVNYNPDGLAAGTAEESLRIAYWDGVSWQIMKCTVDAAANTVSTSITKVI